jgi:hypothetical protein
MYYTGSIRYLRSKTDRCVDIVVKLLDKEEGADGDIATIIAKEVFNRLNTPV